MTFAVRQTVAATLLGEVEHFFVEDIRPDPFTISRLLRSADGLQRVDAAEASMVKAAIAALQWDAEECRHWVNNAVRLDGGLETLHNAAVSFENQNLMDEALVFIVRAYEMAPQNPKVVRRAVHGFYGAGMLAETAKLIQEATAQGIDLGEDVPMAEGICSFCNAHGISLDRLQFEHNAAMRVLTQAQKRASYLEHEVFLDHDGEKTLVMKVGFIGSLQDELHLEAALAPVLAEEPGWDPNLLSTEFHYSAQKIQYADETI